MPEACWSPLLFRLPPAPAWLRAAGESAWALKLGERFFRDSGQSGCAAGERLRQLSNLAVEGS